MVATPINTDNAVQIGRAQVIEQPIQDAYISFDLSLASALDVFLDFATIDQPNIFGIPRTLFFDNATNPEPVEVLVEGTRQQFTIPPLSSGYYPLNCPGKTRINFVSDGGATDICNVAVYNYYISPVIWYANGQVTPLNGVEVWGPDVIGAVATQPPVFVGGLDAVNHIAPISITADGVKVDIAKSVLPTGAATSAKQDDIITALGLLGTEATAADILASIGDPSDAAWDGVAASASAIAILKAIWIKLP